MNNNNFEQIEDFLRDDSFANWVRKSNEEDIQKWESWLVFHPDKKELLEDAKSLVIGLQFKRDFIESSIVKMEWKKLDKTLSKRQTKIAKQRINRPFWLGIAASIAFLLAISFWYSMEEPQVQLIHRTAYGEQIDLKLPDGTDVTLNANSVLRYNQKDTREVWLEGEAFFKVAKIVSTKAKFWVHTKDLTVEVLGTQFNVNTQKAQTEVLLEEGKINLQYGNGEQKNMLPGDLVVFSSKQNKLLKQVKVIKPELHTSWKEGTLIFENRSLGVAMEKISSTYGLEIIFQKEEIANRNIHLAVPTKNLDICILAFEKALALEIEVKDKKLIIKE